MRRAAQQLFAVTASAVLFSGAAAAQVTAVSFAAPVRLKAGEAWMGGKRLYPSPVFHDVNGDGLADLVLGDLRGRLTVALRERGEGAASFGAESKLEAADGKELDFANW